MEILHISAECYPIAKVGGLADVVGALPKYQSNSTISSQVIMPLYNNKFTKENTFETVYETKLTIGGKVSIYRILTLKNKDIGFNIFFVDIPELLFNDFVYSNDDTDRFLAFQIAVLDWIMTLNEKPTIVHCHDHHTGLIPFMMTQCNEFKRLRNIPTVLTIHNAQYQGWFSHNKVSLIPEFNIENIGLIDWDGSVNPLAAAIKCAWKVTTVSPSYMEELKLNANGLEDLLSHESKKCVGVLNGIDAEVWNPETDNYLERNYRISNVQLGRKMNKKWLCKEFNLDFEKPLFAFIGRLVGEKGADLLPEVFKHALEKEKISILLLGSGHDEIEEQLNDLIDAFSGSYNAFIGYDERLSHIIYGGADFLLMPSRVEPCGLNQMYALKYGSVPIVRSIGGLKDTIIDINEEDGFGICHNEVTVHEITNAMERGVALYQDQSKFRKIRKKMMGIDHSWNASALEYIDIYKSLKN
ncbi:MAG: glycogen synthase [Lutibacter sp.]|nr:MAG: glycogen synthase [Lutibacter sp.]